jgi:hypothetical protein
MWNRPRLWEMVFKYLEFYDEFCFIEFYGTSKSIWKHIKEGGNYWQFIEIANLIVGKLSL